MKQISKLFIVFLLPIFLFSCQEVNKKEQLPENPEIQKKVDEFVPVELSTDLSHLTDKQKELVSHLIDAAKIMDDIFWMEAYGDKDELFDQMEDKSTWDFAMINYGPWERLNNNESFMPQYGEKPKGANFYPQDMTEEEFNKLPAKDKSSLYTMVRRNEAGDLYTIPYHEFFKEELALAIASMQKAADLAEDEGLKNYLTERIKALQNDDYFASDLAWMDMKTSPIDFVVGPIENYEDRFFGYKAAHESFVLIKDMDWSEKLAKFSKLLPELQLSLPVADEYKQEVPGSDSDIGVYDAIYYAGDCNGGSKTIAINLPNDERVHIQKGSRKLQLKNSMKYKFDKILVPISNILIREDQRKHIKFDAFFENTMFHEVAHGLGIKNTINGKGTVRGSLKELYSPFEEGKADIVGLYMVTKLADMGEFGEKDLMDNFVTFMAGIFRSVRFGATSSHGKANMVRFNYFKEVGAFEKMEDGTYAVDYDAMYKAMLDLSEMILTIQGNGDYDAAKKILDEKGFVPDGLMQDLNRIKEAGIPRDIVFKQGKEVLGL